MPMVGLSSGCVQRSSDVVAHGFERTVRRFQFDFARSRQRLPSTEHLKAWLLRVTIAKRRSVAEGIQMRQPDPVFGATY